MLDISIRKKIAANVYNYKLCSDSRIIAIMGESGSGKTTFLKLLSGLLEPDEGYIKVDENYLYKDGDINLNPGNRNIAYVFQNDNIFPHLSVEDNIKLGLDKSRHQEIAKWLKKVGLISKSKIKPKNLSGGEKQKIALIRGLLHNPRLLLLDEAFSSLDETNKEKLYKEIKELLSSYHGHTILVTHDFKEALKIADEIYYLNNGLLSRVYINILDGKVEKLISDNKGDIFTLAIDDFLINGVVLKEFITAGDSIRIEIEALKIMLNPIDDNDIDEGSNNYIGVLDFVGKDICSVQIGSQHLYVKKAYESCKPGDKVNVRIKYKDVIIVK